MLVTQLVAVVCWDAPYALVVSRDCLWFADAIAWLGMVRWSCLNNQLLWMVIMAHGCCQYRGRDPDPDPDYQVPAR